MKTLFDDNRGVAYEFGIQGNNFTGCSSSSLSFITGQPGFCLHGGNVSVAGGGGNVSARAIDATVDKDGNIIILGTQPSSAENDLVIGNVTVPASDDQHQAFYLVRYNTTAYEFDFFTLGGHGDANSSAIAVASIPYGDIVVLGDRPSCSQSVDCSLTFGSNTLQGSEGQHAYVVSFDVDRQQWGWLEYSRGDDSTTKTKPVDMVIDSAGDIHIVGELVRPTGTSAGFGSWPVQLISGSAVYVARLIPGVIDLDHDGVYNHADSCPSGHTGWVSVDSNDYDGDGCLDSSEDHDDDDDSILDVSDSCPFSSYPWGERLVWVSGSGSGAYDHDSDGCHDSYEDADDDNDGVLDPVDQCPTGSLNWTSNQPSTDFDGDGCQDSTEDSDDDDDGVPDQIDLCPKGVSNA